MVCVQGNSNSIGILGVAVLIPTKKTLPSCHSKNIHVDMVTSNHAFHHIAVKASRLLAVLSISLFHRAGKSTFSVKKIWFQLSLVNCIGLRALFILVHSVVITELVYQYNVNKYIDNNVRSTFQNASNNKLPGHILAPVEATFKGFPPRYSSECSQEQGMRLQHPRTFAHKFTLVGVFSLLKACSC